MLSSKLPTYNLYYSSNQSLCIVILERSSNLGIGAFRCTHSDILLSYSSLKVKEGKKIDFFFLPNITPFGSKQWSWSAPRRRTALSSLNPGFTFESVKLLELQHLSIFKVCIRVTSMLLPCCSCQIIWLLWRISGVWSGECIQHRSHGYHNKSFFDAATLSFMSNFTYCLAAKMN